MTSLCLTPLSHVHSTEPNKNDYSTNLLKLALEKELETILHSRKNIGHHIEDCNHMKKGIEHLIWHRYLKNFKREQWKRQSPDPPKALMPMAAATSLSQDDKERSKRHNHQNVTNDYSIN